MADPALQLFRLERLVEKVVGPLFQVASGETALVRDRDPDNRQLLLAVTLSQHAHQTDAIDLRHIVVDQSQPDAGVLLQHRHRFARMTRLVHLQQLLAQLGHGAVAGGARIIDDQHFDGLVEIEAVHQADRILQRVARILHHIVQYAGFQPGGTFILADIGGEDHHWQAALQQHADRFSVRCIRQGQIHQGDYILISPTVTGAFEGIKSVDLQTGLLGYRLGQHTADRQAIFDNQYLLFH